MSKRLEDYRHSGADLIGMERSRQIEDLGYTAEHDDNHWDELLEAAVCYAVQSSESFGGADWVCRGLWPSDWNNRPESTLDDLHSVDYLIKAGALIAAEIDRRLRRLLPDEIDPLLKAMHGLHAATSKATARSACEISPAEVALKRAKREGGAA